MPDPIIPGETVTFVRQGGIQVTIVRNGGVYVDSKRNWLRETFSVSL